MEIPIIAVSVTTNQRLPQKCDEQREGDSCKTCKRLTIKCLGWGAKRPDWMRVSAAYGVGLAAYRSLMPISRRRKTSTRTKPASRRSSLVRVSSAVNQDTTHCQSPRRGNESGRTLADKPRLPPTTQGATAHPRSALPGQLLMTRIDH